MEGHTINLAASIVFSLPSHTTSDGREVIPLPCPVNASYTTTDPPIRDLHAKSPLPLLSKIKPTQRRSMDRSQDPLKVSSCPIPPSHKAETMLDCPMGPSSLEAYTLTKQVRERFAIGLWGIFDVDNSWNDDIGQVILR
jgi:hypothetical protein